MKRSTLSYSLILLAVVVRSIPGQTQISNPAGPSKTHIHYKVIDTGSFGGPNSHMSLGVQILNDAGTFTGYADTDVADPYAPDGCWDGDCLVAHTFRWKDGKLTDLGVLDGGPNSESNWVSSNGFIAGDSQNGLLDPLMGGWEIRGVVWLGDRIDEVGTLAGGYESLARAVNSSGEVVGLSTTTIPDPNAMILNFGLPYAFQTRAFRWKNGVLEDLGTLGGPDAMAVGINDAGQIIGNSYVNTTPSPACGSLTTGAFLWQRARMIDLGTLGGTCTNVSAINNRGQVIGYSSLSGDDIFHPFLWERGDLRDLGTLGGKFGFAGTIDDAGDAVGFQSLAGNEGAIHATLWSRGQITDLGALGPGQCSLANGVNTKKQVVGLSGNCNFEDPTLRAFLWEPGGPMLDLNELISPVLGIQLRNVSFINSRGEMAAVAFFQDGNHRPVLLIPCDSQENGVEDCQDTLNPSGKLREIMPHAFPSAKRNAAEQESLPVTLQGVLARWHGTHDAARNKTQ